MKRDVRLAIGLLVLLCAAVVLWPGDAPSKTTYAEPPRTRDSKPSPSDSFLHANWDTAPAQEPAKARQERTPGDRTAVELPAGLRGVEVALPVPPPEKQR